MRNDVVIQILLWCENDFYVDADSNEHIIKDIVSANDNATHAVAGVSLMNAARLKKLSSWVTRGEHELARKRYACRKEFMCLSRATR